MKKRILIFMLCAVGMTSLLVSCTGGTGRSMTGMSQSAARQSRQETDGIQSSFKLAERHGYRYVF